jgi:TRAP-type uncharacterized transport system substrate-binding protein
MERQDREARSVRDPRVWHYHELLHRRHRGRLLGWLALASFVMLALILIRFLYLPRSVLVTISAGNTEGTVHQFLLSLAHDAAQGDLDIEPVITTGSLDSLKRVDSGELDFAIIQGGSDMDRYRNIRQVGVLSVGPVHLLIKEEYHVSVLEDLRNLRGRTINLGSGKRTGTFWLSQEILAFAGLTPADYRPQAMTSDELRGEDERKRLPDAIFISTMPPSELVQRLVVHFGYRLVPLPFGDAFRLTALQEIGGHSPPDGIRREHIVDATIPAYTYQTSPPVPPRTIATLGCRILLITNRLTDRATVVKLLDLMIASRFAEAMQPSLDAAIVRQHAEVPWHPGALDYRGRDDPLITGEKIGVLSNALQILLPAGGALLLLWGWLRNRVLTRRELRFDRFIALVSGVERRALELEEGATHDHQAIRKLHRELSTIKDAALARIAVGEASDNTLVMSLFAHIGDVRAFLADLERSWYESGVNRERIGSTAGPFRPEDEPS